MSTRRRKMQKRESAKMMLDLSWWTNIPILKEETAEVDAEQGLRALETLFHSLKTLISHVPESSTL